MDGILGFKGWQWLYIIEALPAFVVGILIWVLLADKQGLHYGLRLGNQEIATGSGEAHRRNCLQALALTHTSATD